MTLKKLFFVCSLIVFSSLRAQDYRTEINIPDIPGYKVLKCDFHIHTVFSDGQVWPDFRAGESWRDGLDAFAITDHIEYLPHKEDMVLDFNRSFEIAKSEADGLDLIAVKGAEITRPMPPGHFNALFLKDNNSLDVPEWRDAIKAAADQGTFIFWNHPGWSGQQADSIAKWYEEHTEMLSKKWLHGIEVVNGPDYDPIAHKWCIERGLTMLANSDVHSPISANYDKSQNQHRPLTLVFVKEKSEQGLKDALFAGNTVLYWNHHLIGKPEFLLELFWQSVSVKNNSVKAKGWSQLQINNNSEIDFELVLKRNVDGFRIPSKIKLNAGKTILFGIEGLEKEHILQQIRIPFTVKNMWPEPEKGLEIGLDLNLTE